MIAKYDFTNSCTLLKEFETKIDRKKLVNNITLIERIVESGDPSEDRAVIRKGIYLELDQLRESYSELNQIMSN